MENFELTHMAGERPLSSAELQLATSVAASVFAEHGLDAVDALAARRIVQQLDDAGEPEDQLPKLVRAQYAVLALAEHEAESVVGRGLLIVGQGGSEAAHEPGVEDEDSDPVG